MLKHTKRWFARSNEAVGELDSVGQRSHGPAPSMLCLCSGSGWKQCEASPPTVTGLDLLYVCVVDNGVGD